MFHLIALVIALIYCALFKHGLQVYLAACNVACMPLWVREVKIMILFLLNERIQVQYLYL